MDNIVVADKQSAVATQSAWGNVSLNGPGVVQMPVSPDKVATVTQRGQDLIVTLKSGEKVTIGNFFAVDQAGVGSDIVFVGEDGTLWHANYDAAAFTGFTFDEVASLDELVAGIGVAGSEMPTWAIAGLSLLGIGGAAAAADSSGGGSSGSSDPGDTTAPATPIDLLVSPDGLRLTGRGEAGTTVNIRDAAGNLIGSGTVGADGSFNVSLTPPQINSENLQVTLTDGAGNVSAPGSVTAPDATAPVAPTELAINEQGTTLTGRAEPGSTVAVRGAGGVLLGSAVAGADGQFSITLQPAQTDGQDLEVTAQDAAGNTSPAAGITAPDVETPPDTTPPDAPTDLLIALAGRQLSGRGEAGTTVQVRDAAGNVLATGTVGADGTFVIALDPAVIDGSTLQVTLTDAAGNVSQPGSVTSQDQLPPAQPTDLALAEGVTLTGRGEPGATVQVRDAAGNVIGTALVGADGSFSLTLSPAQANGEALDIRQVDAAGNTSAPLQFDAPDITPPAAVSNIVVGAGGVALSGRGEPGATVEVRDANGNVIGTGTVLANGTFLIDLDPAVQPGEHLSLVQTDPSGNASVALEYDVPLITAPASPSDLAIDADGTTLTGTAPAGSRVEVHDANGTLIGSAIAGADGTFTLELSPVQANGELLDVVAIDDTGLSSLPAQITAPDITAPAAPSELTVSADGTVITGRAEPGSTVRILAADGTELGNTLVGPTGVFNITLAPPQIDGEVLQATATDAAGNTSTASSINAPDIDGGDTTPPDAPVDLVIGLAGHQLTGRGEAGTTVQVRDAAGNVLATGTVGADGTFVIALDPAVIDGSTLQVTLTDAAGNISQPGSVASQDLLPPAQPTDLALAEGVTLTGRGEPGATVQVRDAAGTVIGTGLVGADGLFSVTLAPAQANGEALDIRLVDAAGNSSAPLQFDAPDITPPAAVSNIVVGAGGVALSGRGEPGATVEVRDANGNVIGTGTVLANGTFLIDLDPAVQPGEHLSLVQTDPSGNASVAFEYDVPQTTAPASPSGLAIDADGTTLTGTAPAGSRVEVHDANGTLIGSAIAGADGTFTLELNPAQANGELLDVVAIDDTGLSSLPAQITAPDITAPAAPSELAVSADGTVVTGRAEPGSTVRILAADGTELGSALVGPTGVFNITLAPPQVDGEVLQATATDDAGNTSTASSVTAPDIDGGDTTPPDAPVDLVIGLAGHQLTGRGEAGTTVQVRDAAGNVLATGTVGADGSFVIALDPAVIDGSTLQVTLTDAAGNVSPPGSVASQDLLPPAQPTDLALAEGVTLTGRGEPGATVQVRDAAGTVIGTGLVGTDGSFSLTLSPAQANGEALDIRQVDAAGNSSAPLQFNVPDITPPDAVSNIVVGPGGLALGGRGEAGATVEVRDADGNLLGRGVVGANGTFLINLDPAAQPGEQLSLVQVDPSGNASAVVAFDVPLTTAPASPSGLAIDADGTTLTGTAPAGSRVEVHDANGTLIGSAIAGADGTFTIELNPAQANGELLDLVAIDDTGLSSLPAQITAPDITAPTAPSELAVSADGTVITGRAEPGSTVRILAADGTELGSALVGPTGVFNITLNPPQVDGETLQATATDAAGNTSLTSSVIAPDIDGVDTTPPSAPTNLVIGLAGTQLSGRGEAGTTVQVRDVAGNVLATGSVAADGTFVIALDPAVIDGSTLQVTLTDAAGNVSQPGSVASQDLLPPAQPTDLALAEGVTLTGRGEPGATVQVRDAAGNVIGTGLVNADGSFSLTLAPAQANGEALDIRLVDAAGNTSAPLQFDAPDITPPAAVSDIVVGADGLMLSGRGEAGASVEVRDADGNVIGTGTVAANGTFIIDLDPAVQPGEQLSLVQTDPSGNASVAFEYDVPLITAPASPSDLAIDADGTTLTGTAPAGSRVEVHDANGTLIGSTIAGADGTFTLELNPAQANGELLDVVAIDDTGLSSLPAQINAPDITAPAAPAELAVNANGTVITGRAEPGSTVRILAADGTELGTALVGPTGVFNITLDPPQVDGEVLQATATDVAGNTSTTSSVTAPDIDGGDTTPPEAPTNLVIGLAGAQLSGRGEAGTTVQVRDAAGNVLATGTVGADGTFVIALDPAVIDGSTLQVTLTDAAGNVSPPGSVASQDLLPPAQPTDLALTEGVTLTGRGEPGATVQVRDAAGTVIGTGLVGADGLFSVTLAPAQANGEALDIRQLDAAGNSSAPLQFDAPDITPPGAVSDIVVGAGGLVLSGRGEAGASVEVRDADGNVTGTGTVAANGTFIINLDPAVQPGEQLSLVQTDPSGNASVAFEYDVPLTTAPASPSGLAIDADGTTLTGTAPAGSRVEVHDANGTLIGSAIAGADGTFTLELTPPQANGELLDVVAIDDTGLSSLPAQITAPDITAPTAPSELAVSADGTVVTGRAEPGSTVRILAADGTELGSALVGPTGVFNITLDPPQVDGEVLQATATDAAGNTSTASSVTAPDIDGGDTTPPEAPTNLVIGLAGSQLSGRGEAGTTVQVRDAAGNVLATGTVGADGTFVIALAPAVIDGSTLQVNLTDAAGNVSQPGSVASQDLLPPAQPTDLALAEGVTLTGRGEPGATVQVRDAAGTVIGTALVGADGLFSVTLAPAQANGEALDIRLVDAAGNSSTPLQFDAPDITPPAAVSGIVIGAGGLVLSGRGEASASVEVRDTGGNLIGTGTVGANGTFTINLDPAVQPGEQLSLVQTDPSGNASVAFEYDVPLTTAPASPSGLVIDADGTTLTGTAPAGSRVEVHDANGTLIGSAIAGADGTFTLELSPVQANGELLDVVAIDDTGLSSLPVQITAPDITAPAAPSELAVSADGTLVTGRAEPDSTVRILAADGTELGTALVGPTGIFSITLDPPQVDGEVLQATATDAAGNASTASSVTAPDIDGVDITPPSAPANLVIGLAGTQLSGRGEAGTTVQVRDAAGNVLATGTVGADGTFVIALDPAVIDGSTLQVTLTDAAGNVSQPGSVASQDLLPPAQPTDLALAEGVTLTGRGEPGATVQVRDAAGTVIGTALVGADGLFSVTLAPAQANGEALDVRVEDAAGNTSAPLQFDAPDITPPGAVSNIVVGADGLTLSGRGEAGASVEVRDASGNVIGTGTVLANGTFLIDLDPAAQPGAQLSLVQTDPSGNASEALLYDVPLTTAPASPSDLVVAEDGTSISGNAPAGTRVEVHDANGTLVGSVVAGADGTFTVILDPAQANGELLDVVAIDDTGLSSLPVQIAAPDITAPTAPSELAVSADGSTVTGRAEPGSTVRILAADGSELGTALVGPTGTFNITLDPPQVDGEVLQVTATDAAGNTSTAGTVTAPDIDGGDTTPPEAPTNLVIGLAGSQLNGRGEAGASVQVRDAEGNLLATGTVNPDGSFQLTLDPAVNDGSTLQVVLTDAAGNASEPGSVISPDLLAPEQPTGLGLANGVTLTGSGEPGATVQVRNAAGDLIGTGLVNDNGSFSLTLFPAQANGEALDVRLVDAAGNSSTPLQFDAPDITPPAAVSNIVVGADGLALSGRGEAGASVEVRDADGNLIGTGTVGENGTFLIDLAPAAQPGAQLSLVQTDPSGNASEALLYDVPLTTAPASPSDLVVAEDGTSISGSAPAGTRVEVHDANGTLVGSVVVGAEGTFTVILNPAQANGELLDLVAIDGTGASSLPVQVGAPDITAPATPTELAVSTDGSVVTGRAEAGSTVRILAADGTELGSALVGPTGIFNITLDPPQVDGEVLQVSATDNAGNSSTAGTVTAPDIDGGDTTPPEAPTNLVIGLAGSQLNGRGEAGASVQVRDAEGTLLATGTVNPDGSFQLTLDPAVKDGSTLQVVLTDAAGNASEPGSVISPDLQAPEQPTGLALANGVTLTGSGEPGATVQVRDADGDLIGTGLVNDNGSFSLTLSPAQANGEALDIRLVDAAGNTSAPLQFDAPDITPPAAVSTIVVGADGLTLSGRGEAGASVEVRDVDGNLLGSGTVLANGTFLVDLNPAAQPGERLSLVQTDAAGNASEALQYDVPLATVPTSPSELVVAEDGTSISGSAQTGTRVEVHDANGTLVGSVVVGAEGTFTVVLTPAQANGELLDVVAIDSTGASSLPVQVSAPDITAPDTPTELAVSTDGSVVTGRAEAGSTVRVLAADGTELGSTLVGPSGAFSVTLTPPQVDGEQLQVTATDTTGNSSTAGTVTAPDIDNGGDTTPPEPATDLVVSDDGRTVSGRGEPGATVEVRNDQGQLLQSGTVGPDGDFTVQLPSAVVDGSSLQVTLTDAAGNVSQPGSVATPDQVAPLQPTDLVLTAGNSLTGSAEPGARVNVRDALGDLIGSAIVEPDGTFTLTLNPAQANGETLAITVVDAADNASVPLSYVAPDITAPAIITDVVAGAGSLAVSGRGEAGAEVEVRDAGGTVIGTGTVAPNGTFVIDLANPLAAGESILLVQTDAAGNTSVGIDVIVADAPLPESPSDLVLAPDGSSISGTAPAGTQVEVRDAQGTVIGSVQAGTDGTFTIGLTPAQANGEVLDVVAVDADGNSSLPAQITAPDITPPNQASDLQLSADGSVLTGRGEPGTTVQVINAQGDVLGNAQVGDNGVISVILTPAQTDGQELDVVLRDPAGNTSSATVNAPDLDGPLQPSGLAIDTAGIHLTGQGQSGSIVTVRAEDGTVLGTATVAADGRFDVTLNQPQRNGESLTVEATDNLGNSAGPVDFTAPDTTPPQEVTGVAIDDVGTTVTGTGEPDATVIVRGPDGTVLGSVVVGAGGTFEITLDTPQTNGQALTVEQRDPTGNLSTAVTLPAPDSEAPDTPTGLTLSGDGRTLSGTGEPGAQVTVTGTAGAIVGTAVVEADGSFRVSIDPPQLNGQTLSVTQADGAGNDSTPGTVTAPDLEAPAAAQGLGLNPEGTVLSGQGEPGSTVEVRNAAGDLLGTLPVGEDGTFSVTLTPAQTNGEVLSVVLIDSEGNASPSATFTADDSTAPTAPDGLSITPGGNAIQGTGEAGSTVEVRTPDGTLVGSVVVPAGGLFTVPLAPAQLDGQALDVTLTDAAGNQSLPTQIIAPDVTPPALPTDVVFSPDGTTVTGNAPGATSVTVRDADGNETTEPVNPDGSFSVTLPTPQTNGESVTVVVTDGANNGSAPITITAPDTTDPLPATGVTVNPDGSIVGGGAEPGSTVVIRNPDGSERGSETVGPDGTFVVPVSPPLTAGETVDVVVIDPAGNESIPVSLDGPNGTEAATPSGLALSADGFLLIGQGTVGSLITVTAGGTTLGTATVGSDGTFRVFFQNAQLNGETLVVTARTSVDGNPSVPATLVANDSTAPDAPTQVAIDRTGSTLTGQGEVGATVRVVNAQGDVLGTATVGSNGLFSISFAPALANAQNLIVTQADGAGNVSLAATLQAPDLQAPLAANNLSLNSAATVLSGEGEAGANVTVRDASGAILATGTVNQNGQFQITLPSAQTDGSPLQVTLSDAAGNVSGPASMATPDRTPPAAISNPVLSQDGRQLSGSGEVGATVQVRNAAGTVLGTAVVGADGRFTVVFDTPQANGQAIGVTQVDAAGNTSTAVNVNTPDLTPPAPLTNVVLNNNGLTLSGLGEAGATVTVRGPDGTIIGTGLVAANGSFTLTLDNAQLNAQHLSVTQTDAGNNTSTAVAVTAPDFTPPPAPTTLALAATGLQLTGNAEAGSTVTVRDAAGNVLGTAVAGSNGTFQVTLNSAQTNGQTVQVTATDAAGNVSPAAPYTAADTTPPAVVTNLAVAANGATLTGTGEANATVTVRAPDGSVLGTATVGADGHFSVALSPAAITGESLSVVQADAAQNVSPAQTVTAPGVLAPDTPDNLVLAADGLAVTGTATPGSTVNVYGPNGVLLGTAPVANDGTFTVNLGSAQANGEVLQVSAVGTDGSTSLPASLQAPDTTAPLPLTNVVLSSDGLVLSGRGEPGATVTVIGEGGIDLGTGLVDVNGNFSIGLGSAQINGEQLSASQSDVAGNESNSISLTAPDRVAPDAAENLAFAGGGSLLNGTGEAGATVRVLAADGSVLGTAVVRGDGSFQVDLGTPQANGQQVQVVQIDAAGNQSDASAITAPDTTPPAAPTELAISSDGITLTGRGEVGAEVIVTAPNGDEVGRATVDASGHFTVTLTPALGNSELLSFTQTDAAGNVSAVATLQTPDFTPPAALTEVDISVDGSVVTGLGEAGATVTVRNTAGTVLGFGTVQADGSFRVELTPAQINSEPLSVQQADPPGNISAPVNILAPDLTPPAPATELRLNVAGDQLSGIGEAGATVRVYVGITQIGTIEVGADGKFVVDLSSAQLDGQVLQVTLTDPRGNVSPISTTTAADITPPATVIAVINDSGTQLVGTGEAGARVTVVNNNGDLLGQVTVDPDGTFVLDLNAAQINGQTLTLIAQDATGNPSAPLQVNAPDLTPPLPPTDLLLNPAGTSMTGTAEAGTTITVRGPNNAVVGTVEVPENGQFTVTLNPAQNNGQLLTVVSTDDAGNASLPASYQTNDTSPPAVVTDMAINNTFNVLTGKGEPNATVTVSRGGIVLGTGEVDAAGNFQVTLVPAAGSLATLAVTQSDGFNTSAVATYITPLLAPPVPPTNVTLGSDGLTLSGNAPSGVGIRVYDAAGNLIGTGGATLNGTFTLQLDTAQLDGQHLSVTAVALVGGESQPTFVQAADITPPANPLVTGLSANGLVLTGTGEANATVTVRDAANNVLGTGVVNAGGVFSINLITPQLNGQVLAVSQADTTGNASGSTSFTAIDVQPPVAPTNVVINGTGTELTGRGEAGATVTVQGPSGPLGSAVVQPDGTFTITLTTAQNDGQLLVVRQSDPSGNLSASISLTAPDTTPPAAPLATINANGTAVSGSGQVGSTVTVRNSAGTVLGTATVGSNGLFVVSLTAAQIDNQALSVTLTDGAGNASTGTALTAPDLTPPAAASNLVISADGSSLTGSGEVGATVTVRSANGTVLQTAVVQPDGNFTVALSPPQDNGQLLSVTLSDGRGNVSGNVNITAPDVDANAPVIASDNLVTAEVNLAPVVSSRTYQDSFTTLLAGFTKTYTWTVGAGTTVDPTLTLNTSSALSLLDNTTFTLQVKNADGNWVTLATGTSQGLLDLILLPLGQGIRVDIGVLQAGDYRLTVGSGGIGLITNVTTTLDIETTSLTQFTGTGTATSGNVITDVGTDGAVDALGPDSAAVLQVMKDGSYVSAGSATTVQGLYGTLVIRGDGSYTYTPNGSPSSVGKVDVFSYQLLHANGASDAANLYVRIDSPQATEIWSDSNYGAPATVVDAVNDAGTSHLTLANRVDTNSDTLGTLRLPLIGSRQALYDTSVAADTTANLQVVVNSTNLLSLLNGTTLDLLKLNPATGQYVLVQSVGGGSLISLLGGGAGYTFQNQGAGAYQIRVTAGGIGLASSITTSVNATTTHLTEFVVSGATAVTGNLLTDDNVGSPLTVLSVMTAANTYTIPGYNGVSVEGNYGTLLVHADGSYTYTLDAGLTNAVIGQHETFTYELTHPNGTTDTANLTINLDNAANFTATSSLLADTGDEGVALASIAAAASSEVIAGTDGNDHLDGSQGGHITLQGGAGDDTLVVVDQNFASVDGGTGTDTLLWGGGDASIDLGNLAGRVHDIEVIDLNDTSSVALTLNLADVVAITETGTDTLVIKGDENDSVHMTDNWALVGNQTADGIDYNQYTAQEDPSQHLWVQNGIHVV